MDKTEQAERAILIFCALAMTMSDEYTRFLGMFKFKEKQKFNDLVKACEAFVKTMKDNLTEEKQENVQELVEEHREEEAQLEETHEHEEEVLEEEHERDENRTCNTHTTVNCEALRHVQRYDALESHLVWRQNAFRFQFLLLIIS